MVDVVDNQEEKPSFEDFKHENGTTFWWASDLMSMLGYKDAKSFQKVLDRTTKAFVSLNIPHYENIVAEQRTVGGRSRQDFKLSRFACYLTVMNGSTAKIEVAQAQTYFVQQTRKFELSIQSNDEFQRLLTREELAEGNKSLASVGQQAGGKDFDFSNFQNAGYLGMYNMTSGQLALQRNVRKEKLMDYMGRAELAANLFRVTQTEERIKNKGVKGQENLEKTHFQMGKEVRQIIEKNSGKNPEDLSQEKQLSDVKKEIKQGHKKMLNEDKKNK